MSHCVLGFCIRLPLVVTRYHCYSLTTLCSFWFRNGKGKRNLKFPDEGCDQRRVVLLQFCEWRSYDRRTVFETIEQFDLDLAVHRDRDGKSRSEVVKRIRPVIRLPE